MRVINIRWPAKRFRFTMIIVTSLTILIFYFERYSYNSYIKRNKEYPHNSLCTSKIKVSKQLLLAYWRGGSSFLGELVQHQPNSFYMYEPLKYLHEERKSTNEETVNDFINDLFECKFSSWLDYMVWMSHNSTNKMLERDESYWKACTEASISVATSKPTVPELTEADDHLCYSVSFITSYCLNASVRIIKVTRLAVKHLNILLKDIPELKALHLVRDPRGIYSSRLQPIIYLWCKAIRKCRSVAVLCNDLRRDLNDGCQIERMFPKRFATLKHKDLSCHTQETTQQLFQFLGYETQPPEVFEFIESHMQTTAISNTSARIPAAYDTHRKPENTVNAWKNDLREDELTLVEDACEDVIRRMGLQMSWEGSGMCEHERMESNGVYSFIGCYS